ncbi:MAG: DNA translocase FtsK 4TM domain-containing protein [Nitrospira sp.]|nr:DNA translocase FtsK 4TM domain-containing protein [Nitrospira sp.]MDH4368212.1 DNA translocase FtsK 4TM domain-containing protein [Nitrospira sp.]MDH5347176.1 DNA translocase FtsK 4TM domain-containing protein [Nitrospira sp.]MDH5723965.1 DNA translocase FtsK 4TM domain-containing protein [Nitrospira sp.]
MGATTSARRGEARRAPSPPSHIQREVIGVILIALSLLMLLSLLSFVPGEAELVASGAPATHPPRNLIGSFGALLAGGCFYAIGGAAYLFPLLLGRLGVRCFSQTPVSIRFRTAASSLTAVVFLSAFLHLETTGVPTLTSGMISRGVAGGAIGQTIAEGLRAVFAGTGAHILIIAGFLVSLLLTTPLSLAEVIRRIPERWAAIREGMFAMIPERSAPVQKDAVNRKVKNRLPKLAQTTAEEERFAGGMHELELSPPAAAPIIQPFSLSTLAVEEDVIEPEVVASQADSEDYRLPDPELLLSDPSGPLDRMSDDELKAQSDVLLRALASFGVEGTVTEVRPGPVVTMYEFEPAPGTKVARIVNLADDLALALKATSLRIVAPIPGKSVVGIEVPNRSRETVSMKEVVMSETFRRARSRLTLALGKDIFGAPITADLKTMPHLLVAGATGAGKSVSLNTMLLSILFSAKPSEVKLLLIDPKMLEFQSYEGIPHLLRPVITDPKSAARGLGWVVAEMERRYKLLAEAGVRNIDAYNRKVAGLHEAFAENNAQGVEPREVPIQFLSEDERLSAGESSLAEGERGCMQPKPTPPEPLPFIVVMIDELADLMMVAPKDVEDKIARLAQMARASGIHLVLATQRPSVDVLTGLIKANFPARIAFQVSSKTDSRTILDANGAEALLGRGDMLYLATGTGRLARLHGSFVSDDDVRSVVEFVKEQAIPVYNQELQSLKLEEAAEEEAKDEVYEQAKELVLSTGQASASLIQRRLRVGYPRAARMIEQMESDGIVGAAGRDGRREVLGRRGPVGAAEA